MVDDILLTPEEQDERAKKWLKDNGLALALGIGLGLAAVFGYNTYQDKLKSDAEQASLIYNEVITAVQNSELSDISSQVEMLKSEYGSTPYAAKASLVYARQLSVNDLDAALAELEWVAQNAEEIGVVNAANLRRAKILLTLDRLEEAKALASQSQASGFKSHNAEILGDVAARQGDHTAASKHYQTAIDALEPSDFSYRSILTLKLNRLPAAAETESAAESE